jgi:hypothetical protein
MVKEELMRLKAYILAADPAWIEASVLSYYDMVEEIVVSYDRSKRGWTGAPIGVDECLDRLQGLDRDKKLRLHGGDYARLDHHPMDNETYQRRCALDQASSGADWILQLDTDEVMNDPTAFHTCLLEAADQGFYALDYPSRSLYRQLGNHRYLELCSRLWQIIAHYPGPLAVQAKTRLRLARQCDAAAFRVDFDPQNTSPWLPRNAPVHRVVRIDQAVYHFSWVRDEQLLRRKSRTSGHAHDFDWDPELQHWAWCGRHPYLAMLRTPFTRRRFGAARQFRIVTIPLPAKLGQVSDDFVGAVL